MTTSAFSELDRRLRAGLALDLPPVAVTFLDAAPAGVRWFMGQAPSSCSFWRVAAEAPEGRSAFVTTPPDHWGCPIGSYTHRADLPPERAHELTDVLGFMAGIGYVRMEEVPSIPRWEKPPAAILYARLGETPVAPDVVLFALRPSAAMLLGEAARAARVASSFEPLPRPTCMALPAAAASGATTALGCVGNRVYTDLPESHMYMVVRGADLEAVAGALDGILAANAQLDAYHRDRRKTQSSPAQ